MNDVVNFDKLKILYAKVYPNGQPRGAIYTAGNDVNIREFYEAFVMFTAQYSGARTMLKNSPEWGSTYVEKCDLVSLAINYFDEVHNDKSIWCAKLGPLAGANNKSELFGHYKKYLKQRLFPKPKEGDGKVPEDMLSKLNPGGRTSPDFEVRDADGDDWQPLPASDFVLDGENTVEDDVIEESVETDDEIEGNFRKYALTRPIDGDPDHPLLKKECRFIFGEWVLSNSDIADINLAATKLFNKILSSGKKKSLVLGIWSAFYLDRDGKVLVEKHLAKDGKTVVPTQYATTSGYAKEAHKLIPEVPNANNAGYIIGQFGVEHNYFEQKANPRTTVAKFLATRGWAPSGGEPRVDIEWKILVRKEFIGDLAKLAFNYVESQGYRPNTRYASEIQITEESSDDDTQP